MSYYQGDFTRMAHMRGDPGFFSFAKSLVGSAVSMVPGIGGLAGKLLAKRAPTSIVRAVEAGGGIVRRVGGAIVKHPVLSAAGAAGVAGALGGIVGRETAGGMAPKGFHLSSKTGRVVKNRRMRVTNPRALRRAIRRATGFARLAKRVLHFTSPRAPRGRAVFKHRKRKRV